MPRGDHAASESISEINDLPNSVAVIFYRHNSPSSSGSRRSSSRRKSRLNWGHKEEQGHGHRRGALGNGSTGRKGMTWPPLPFFVLFVFFVAIAPVDLRQANSRSPFRIPSATLRRSAVLRVVGFPCWSQHRGNIRQTDPGKASRSGGEWRSRGKRSTATEQGFLGQ